MKLLKTFLLSLLICITPTTQALEILTSFYPIYIGTLNVVKDIEEIHLKNLAPPIMGCLHDYQLTAQDMKSLKNSDLFIINGLEMESFLSKIHLNILDSSKDLPTLIKDNPHAWLSITNHIKQIENIRDGISKLIPAQKQKLSENANNYIQKLKLLDQKIKSQSQNFNKFPVITFHEAFPYFAKDYGLNISAVIEREPGSEPNAGEYAKIVTLIKSKKVTAIFVEPQYSSKSAQTIAQETKIKVYSLDPIVTGAMDADAYIQAMEKNLQTLEEVLK